MKEFEDTAGMYIGSMKRQKMQAHAETERGYRAKMRELQKEEAQIAAELAKTTKEIITTQRKTITNVFMSGIESPNNFVVMITDEKAVKGTFMEGMLDVFTSYEKMQDITGKDLSGFASKPPPAASKKCRVSVVFHAEKKDDGKIPSCSAFELQAYIFYFDNEERRTYAGDMSPCVLFDFVRVRELFEKCKVALEQVNMLADFDPNNGKSCYTVYVPLEGVILTWE